MPRSARRTRRNPQPQPTSEEPPVSDETLENPLTDSGNSNSVWQEILLQQSKIQEAQQTQMNNMEQEFIRKEQEYATAQGKMHVFQRHFLASCCTLFSRNIYHCTRHVLKN